MPVNIKGKSYVTVAERLKAFREKYPDYALLTEIVELTEERVVMKASIQYGDEVIATGHAYEDKNSTFINKTSFIENCETSAWGRALANLFGAYDDIASADEVANAVKQQENKPWLNNKEFCSQVDLLNREESKEKREAHVKSLFERYKVNKDYRAQFAEIVNQRDINV